MSFTQSPGVYPRTVDKSFIVPSSTSSIGALVVTSNKGPTTPTLVTSNTDFVNIFGVPSPNYPSKYAALAFLNQSNRLIVTRAISDAIEASGSILDTSTTPVTTFTVNAVNPGAWGDNITIAFNDKVSGDGHFTLIVSYNGNEVESFKVSKNQLQKDGYGNSLYIEDVINGNSMYIRITDDTTNANDPDMTQTVVLSGGADDTTQPTASNIISTWDLYNNKEQYDIDLLINGGFADPSVQHALLGIAQSRGDCFAILDIPKTDLTVTDMKNYVTGASGLNITSSLNASSSWGAIYAGWPQDYDQYNDKTLYMPPSGYVGAVYAYTASQANVWVPPAGSRRGKLNVLGVNIVFSEGDRDALYEASINPIQQFTGDGVQVYGQKTLQQEPSALDRVNVRLLLISIQKALKSSLRSFVFEVNDQFTRQNIKSIIDSYMDNIKAKEGVYDYLCVCDSTNNTPQVIDNEQLIIDLYIKPSRAIEYIRLNTVVTSTGATFSQIQ